MNAFFTQVRMEWGIQRSRPFVWFAMAASFLIAFAATVQNGFADTGFSWVNGADAIATRSLILSVLIIIVAAGVIGEAMSRDTATGSEEMILGAGATKTALGLGRFLVGFAVILAISLMFVPGMIVGTYVPGIPSERLGPFVQSHYIYAVLIYVLPNTFLVSALIYSVAARWRSQTMAFLAALALVALYVTGR